MEVDKKKDKVIEATIVFCKGISIELSLKDHIEVLKALTNDIIKAEVK